MKLLPYRRFTIETRLTPAEVEARLRDAVEAPAFRFTRPERPFTGHVDGPTFDVMRSVQGRNSFRPRVRGTIVAAAPGTRITGTMQLHELVILFMGFILIALGTAFGSMAVEQLRQGRLDPSTLVALGVVVFLAVAMIAVFIPEARRAFDELGRIVDASHGELS